VSRGQILGTSERDLALLSAYKAKQEIADLLQAR
jgi:hypothetical protein